MKKRTGLVLEGGAMRGMFSAGVIDVMMENGIDFDGVIGVSAGACFGGNYTSRQPGRVLRYNLRFAHEPEYCSFRSLLKTGDLYGAEFCYHRLPEELDPMDEETFMANPQKFYVNMTDVDTGECVYREIRDLGRESMECIRASASMPVAARPVEIDGRRYLDGGLSDAIPIRKFEEMGYTKNVIILTRPRDYRKQPQKALGLMKLFLKNYPAVIEALKTRHIRYNATLDYIREQEEKEAVFVIAPPVPLRVGKIEHDTREILAAYNMGRDAGMAALPELREFLNRGD